MKTTIFINHVHAQIDRLVALGSFTHEEFLRPERNASADEVGLKGDAEAGAQVTLVDPESGFFRTRAFQNVFSEKGAFWTTLLLISLACGVLLAFTVVHEAKAATLSKNLTLNLHEDFLVFSSVSGYMERDIFYDWVKWLIAKVDARYGNAFFLYIDGHDSHWDGEMHQYANDRYLFIIFLRSNASITDQPNDNGLNAKFKAAYAREYMIWRQSHSTACPLTRPFVNEIITKAYLRMQADPTLKRCIIEGFKKTRIFPLV